MNTDKHRFGTKISWTFICVHLWLILPSLSAAPRWKIQFFYDHAGSNFAIEDLRCPSARHCVAAGSIDDKRGHDQGAVVVTGDGGLHWSQYEVKERPLSLFFLDESLGWMVTDRGLWSTVEGGRAWIKVDTRKGILQAWFLDASHGYITGIKGLVLETRDGGKNWSKPEISGQAPDTTSISYDIVSFQGTHGVIIGAPEATSPVLSEPRQEFQANRKLTVLETLDGGKQWTYGAIPIDGELGEFKMSDKGTVVTIILYKDPRYSMASAVFEAHLGSTKGRQIFAERDRAASDIALLHDGGAVLVTIEPPGSSPQVPIPGKLKIFRSSDLRIWREMDVDYRAIAQRAIIAAPDPQHMWVATDTGAILGLIE